MEFTGILGWMMFGLIVGAIARLLMPGRQNLGCLLTMALGIVGSLVGGAIASAIWGAPEGFVHPSGWILSILGAMLLLFLFSRFGGSRSL